VQRAQQGLSGSRLTARLSHIGTKLKQIHLRPYFRDDGRAINLDFALRRLVNRAFTFAMIALLPLLFAVSAVADDGAAAKRPARQLASASVTIIQAERITPAAVGSNTQRPDRQVREREAKPLVEFY
jgi:hypothetical protein